MSSSGVAGGLPAPRPPHWLSADGVAARSHLLRIPAPPLGRPVLARLWVPHDVPPTARVPLLLVHDGPEYDRLADLTRYLAVGIRSGTLPPLRAALLDPGERNEWYSAEPRYARSLHLHVVPALWAQAPTSRTIGMGTSLGALSWLHAHQSHPDLLDGLFLQSGSFFQPDLDAQEEWFAGYRSIIEFTQQLRDAPAPRPVPAVLTCGRTEENLANNRRMASRLAAWGFPAELVVGEGGHDFDAWREAFDPALARLINLVVAPSG